MVLTKKKAIALILLRVEREKNNLPPSTTLTRDERFDFLRRVCVPGILSLKFGPEELSDRSPSEEREAGMLAVRRAAVAFVNEVATRWEEEIETNASTASSSSTSSTSNSMFPSAKVWKEWLEGPMDQAAAWLKKTEESKDPAFSLGVLSVSVQVPAPLLDGLVFCESDPDSDTRVWEVGLEKLIEHQLRHVSRAVKEWRAAEDKKKTQAPTGGGVGEGGSRSEYVKDVLLSHIFLKMPDPVEGQSIVYDDLEYDLWPQSGGDRGGDGEWNPIVSGWEETLGRYLDDPVLSQVMTFLGRRHDRTDFSVSVSIVRESESKVGRDRVEAFKSFPLARALAFLAMQDKTLGVAAHLVDRRFHGFLAEADLDSLEDLGSENEEKDEPALIGVDEYGTALKTRLEELVYSTKPLQRGVLLYGPPGTGKTTVIERIFSRTPLFLVTQPMAAGDFSKPYKGMPERILQVFRERCSLLPWQICGVSIDEIDALAPDRMASSQRAGESDLSFQSLVLSVLGGNQNAPNLLLFGSTNRKEAMDAAFLRRVSIHIFVGLPTFEHRRRWLALSFPAGKLNPEESIGDSETAPSSPGEGGTSLAVLRDTLAIATLGFSQDKMNMLRRALNADSALEGLRSNATTGLVVGKEDRERCLTICKDIAVMYHLTLGGFSLPALLLGQDLGEEGKQLIGSEWMEKVIQMTNDPSGPGPYSALTLLCDLGTCKPTDAVQIGYVIVHPILDEKSTLYVAGYLDHFKDAVKGLTGQDVVSSELMTQDRRVILAFLDRIKAKAPEKWRKTLSRTEKGMKFLEGEGQVLVSGEEEEEWNAVLEVWARYSAAVAKVEEMKERVRGRQTELFVLSAGAEHVSGQTYDDIVQLVVGMAIDKDSHVDYVQFFDATTVHDSSERVSEEDQLKHVVQLHATATSYRSSILVFDLDTLGEASDLAGFNTGDSSTFTPLVEEGIGSSSGGEQFVSKRILFRVLRFFVNHVNRVRERRWNESKTGYRQVDGYAHQYIAVSRHPEVTKAFKTQLRWMTEEDWKNFDQHEEDKEWTRCKHCFQAFKPSEAKDGTNGKDCRPHWGKLIYMPNPGDDKDDKEQEAAHEREHAEDFDVTGPVKFEPRPLHWRWKAKDGGEGSSSGALKGKEEEEKLRFSLWTKEWELEEVLQRLREVNGPGPEVKRDQQNRVLTYAGKPRVSVPNPKLRAGFKWMCCGQSLDDDDSPHWELARIHEPMTAEELDEYEAAAGLARMTRVSTSREPAVPIVARTTRASTFREPAVPTGGTTDSSAKVEIQKAILESLQTYRDSCQAGSSRSTFAQDTGSLQDWERILNGHLEDLRSVGYGDSDQEYQRVMATLEDVRRRIDGL